MNTKIQFCNYHMIHYVFPLQKKTLTRTQNSVGQEHVITQLLVHSFTHLVWNEALNEILLTGGMEVPDWPLSSLCLSCTGELLPIGMSSDKGTVVRCRIIFSKQMQLHIYFRCTNF